MVSRRQLLTAGATENDVRRMLRRHELTVWHPGVYAVRAGSATWLQRAWGSVLACWPAVLDRDSALRAENGPGWRGRDDELPIQVAVDLRRTCRVDPGRIDVRRVAHLTQLARVDRNPPRMRVEQAVLDSAIGRSRELDRIEVLARATRSRMTTADRLVAALDSRAKVPDREWLASVLRDVRDGTHSVLEHGYLTLVERAHGLPAADRQLPGVGLYRDAGYERFGLYVELDGRLDHSGAADRADDLARDLAAAADGRRTVRLGWGQVFETGCQTAVHVGLLLEYGGWRGSPVACGVGCPVLGSA